MRRLCRFHLICIWFSAVILATSDVPLVFLDIDRSNFHSPAEGCTVAEERLPREAEGRDSATGFSPVWSGLRSSYSPAPGFPSGLLASSKLLPRFAFPLVHPSNAILKLIAPSSQPDGDPARPSV